MRVPTYEKIKPYGDDEFYDWLKATAKEIRDAFKHIEDISVAEFRDIVKTDISLVPGVDRKWYAERIKKMKYQSIGFLLFDKKDYQDCIWKIVRPKAHQTFKIEI